MDRKKINHRLAPEIPMDVEGDYSDILLYFSNLFAKNRVKSVTIDRFTLSYREAEVIVDVSSGKTETWSDFPDKDAPDRVISLTLLVSCLTDTEVPIKLQNESVRLPDNVDGSLISYFLEVLDRSTFRFF